MASITGDDGTGALSQQTLQTILQEFSGIVKQNFDKLTQKVDHLQGTVDKLAEKTADVELLRKEVGEVKAAVGASWSLHPLNVGNAGGQLSPPTVEAGPSVVSEEVSFRIQFAKQIWKAYRNLSRGNTRRCQSTR